VRAAWTLVDGARRDAGAAVPPGLCAASVSHAAGLPLGGPRHGEVDDVPAELLASSVLVHDGPRWFGVYERFQPVQLQDTAAGSAEVWVVRE
jgi:hypothetical protein